MRSSMRWRWVMAPVLFLMVLTATIVAAEGPLVGNWKLILPLQTKNGDIKVTFLMMVSESDGKLVADVLGASPPLNVEPNITDMVVKDSRVQFTVQLGTEKMGFDGKLNKDGKKISGSLGMGGTFLLVDVLPSKLDNLKDAFALQKENLDTLESPKDFFDNLIPVIRRAAEKKLKPEEVRAYSDKAMKAAEAYGPRWQRTIALRLANSLAEQEPFHAIAIEQARQAERMLTNDDDLNVQIEVLEGLSKTLTRTKKTDEAQKVTAQITKLEAREYLDHIKKLPIKTEAVERKGKSDRVVVMELFTSTEAVEPLPVQIACEAIARSYKPQDVVFLEYHLHFGGLNPLCNPENEFRVKGYGPKVRSLPALFINGKLDESKSTAITSKLKYQSYREQLDELLDKPASGKIAAAASLKDGVIEVKANVTDLKTPGEKTTLRFALTEDRIRYAGSNGHRYHHQVVRTFLGGVKGFPLTKASSEHTATIKLDDLRKELNKYFDKIAEDEDLTFDRPMAFKKLKVVAFIQDDEKSEILNAIQVDLE